jgi:hypothetical protein
MWALSLKDRLVDASGMLPARFVEQKDGALAVEFKVAERRVFLSRKALTYRARLRIDEGKREVRFFETLRETGLGLSTGADGISPGFGFKKETYKITGKEREGSIEELSRLFGKDYRYSFDYSSVRRLVGHEVQSEGYSLSVCIRESSV